MSKFKSKRLFQLVGYISFTRNKMLVSHPIEEIDKLGNFSGVIYSSPEVGVACIQCLNNIGNNRFGMDLKEWLLSSISLAVFCH